MDALLIDFNIRAERYMQITEALNRVPKTDEYLDKRVTLLRERLMLFTDFAEWNLFRISILANKPLAAWQKWWLQDPNRPIRVVSTGPIDCEIEFIFGAGVNLSDHEFVMAS